jgi:molybdopterin-containing oxidoreductase family membrane subunit
LPLSLLFIRRSEGEHFIAYSVLAPLLVVVGGFCQMYVTIIGGQAFPLILFPGHEVHSSFYDGVIHAYNPSMYEWLLGLGGVGITFVLTVVAVRAFKFMPQDDFQALQMRRSTD